MTIDRNNYEEFFLLYADAELSAADRAQVEQFVEENPDLKQELELIRGTRLPSDESILFPGKQGLFRSASVRPPIQLSNHTEYFLLYIDHELTAAERASVEEFVSRHPEMRRELEQLQQSVLPSDESIVFENKELLYRHSRRAVIFSMRWVRVAAAVLILLLGGWLVIDNYSHSGDTPQINPSIAANNNNQPKAVKPENPVTTGGADTLNEQTGQPATTGLAATHESRHNHPENNRQAVKVQSVEPADSNNSKANEEGTVDLKRSAMQQLADGPAELPDGATAFTAPDKLVVLTGTAQAGTDHYPDMTADTENGIGVIHTSSEKNKMRGLFRTVSRVFEKTTGKDADDSKRAVLVGNFQIALK